MKKIIVICFVAVLVFVNLATAGTWPTSGSWTYVVRYFNDGTEDNDKL